MAIERTRPAPALRLIRRLSALALLCAATAGSIGAQSFLGAAFGPGHANQRYPAGPRDARHVAIFGEFGGRDGPLAFRFEAYLTGVSALPPSLGTTDTGAPHRTLRGSRIGAVLRAPERARHSPLLYAMVGAERNPGLRGGPCDLCASGDDYSGPDATISGGLGYEVRARPVMLRVAVERWSAGTLPPGDTAPAYARTLIVFSAGVRLP